MEFGIFIVTAILIMGVSGLIWFIMGKFAKIGIYAIPIVCSILPALSYPEASRNLGIDDVLAIIFHVVMVMLGVIGSLGCYLHAKLDEHNTSIKVLKESKNSINN